MHVIRTVANARRVQAMTLAEMSAVTNEIRQVLEVERKIVFFSLENVQIFFMRLRIVMPGVNLN